MNRRALLAGALAFMAEPRVVGKSAGLPGIGVRDNYADDYEGAAAPLDHTHGLWTPWEALPLNGGWTNQEGALSVCKISEMVMVRGLVNNTGVAASVVTNVPLQYRPINLHVWTRVRSTVGLFMFIGTNGDLQFTDTAFTVLTTSALNINIFNIIYRIDQAA